MPVPVFRSLSLTAISGICGSVSIACWIVVFTPQIIENFRRSSAEALSVTFLVIWLAGDVFNILGGVLQGVLPTMIILAVYYTLADIVLIAQCAYYRKSLQKQQEEEEQNGASPTRGEGGAQHQNGHATERSPLLQHTTAQHAADEIQRQFSVDANHLSPAAPMHPPRKPSVSSLEDGHSSSREGHSSTHQHRKTSMLQSVLVNISSMVLVCFAGVFGWYLSTLPHSHHVHPPNEPPNTPPHNNDSLEFNTLGQVFGYICAALYLGSRIPQLWLNYQRKSTDGISMLFFLFACLGNLTYSISIFAFQPVCGDARHGHCELERARRIYERYLLVNFSWLLGSIGTLFLDMAVFVQYFLYREE